MGVLASSKEFLNAISTGADFTNWTNTRRNGQGYLLVHELDHTLGLSDLYSFNGWLLGWLNDTCISNKTYSYK